MKINWNRLALIVATLAALAALTAPVVEAGGSRLSANIKEPFEINGTLYPASSLSVRHISDYTPTSSFNEIWVGNECLGMVLAANTAVARAEGDDLLFFQRAPLGHLVLTGFAFHGQRAQDLSQIRAGSSGSPLLLASR